MAYLVSKLISEAYYLSSIVARNQQIVSGQQSTDGLDLFKDLLALKGANNRLIPFFTTYTLNAVIGQETYLIPNLIYADSITFNLNTTIRIPLDIQTRYQYFGTVRINDLVTIPFECNINRVKGGANLSIYPLPNDEYPLAVNGKFGFSTAVTEDTDLELTYDRLYIAYLRYALARFICEFFGRAMPPYAADTLQTLEQQVLDLAPLDLTTHKLSSLQPANGVFNWGYVNLGNGFTAP